MQKSKPPFKFDLRKQLIEARRKLNTRIGTISINLPFISFSLNPNELEQRVAHEIVIRMSDKRVLNARECCDNCIDHAIESLQEIRRILVDKQVELSGVSDSPLYLLIELQVESIRQFLTFEQRLKDSEDSECKPIGLPTGFRRPPLVREKYFVGLEILRAHLHRCLIQVAKISNTSIPKITSQIQYKEAWQLEDYKQPTFYKNNGV